MGHGNVLVIGNSGVGKSTLINAVLGDDVAKPGWSTKGTTDKLSIYERKEIPFRIIDTIGFEPSFSSVLRRYAPCSNGLIKARSQEMPTRRSI